MIYRIIIMVAVLTACGGAPYDEPNEGAQCGVITESRCDGDDSLFCSAELRWEILYHCEEYGMRCCSVSGECCDVDAGGADAG